MNLPHSTASKTSKEEPSSPNKKDDLELIHKIRSGDQRAFRTLFERYHRRVFSVAMGVVKNQETARDIVQDAFIKVHNNLDRFEGGSGFYTWLYRIVMNASIDHVRKQSRRRHVDYDDHMHKSEIASDVAPELAPRLPEANPSRNTLRKELRHAIEEALETLPEHHRAVIVLREIEGMSYEEIAQTLDVAKGTIMSRLFHARRKLQNALTPYLEDDTNI